MGAGHVDGYCERTAPGLLDEPLNAVTNLAFVVAAAWLWRLARRHGNAGDYLVWLPIALLFLTGLGSLALHTLASRFGAAVDTMALSACLLVTAYAGARRWLDWRPAAALLWPLAMIGLAALSGWLVPLPGAAYLGAFATGVLLTLALALSRHAAAPWLAAATAVFVPSFTLRALDLPLCAGWPIGTHFGWHLLNAVVLFCAVRPLAVRP